MRLLVPQDVTKQFFFRQPPVSRRGRASERGKEMPPPLALPPPQPAASSATHSRKVRHLLELGHKIGRSACVGAMSVVTEHCKGRDGVATHTVSPKLLSGVTSDLQPAACSPSMCKWDALRAHVAVPCLGRCTVNRACGCSDIDTNNTQSDFLPLFA